MHLLPPGGVNPTVPRPNERFQYSNNCEPAAYERVEAICRSVGLYVVPCGEMECFDKTINKDKKDWVYYVLGGLKT